MLTLQLLLLLLLLLRLPGTDRTTAQVAQEMLAAGFKAVVACLDPKKLPAGLAGRVWDQQLLSELPEGVDVCGEVRGGGRLPTALDAWGGGGIGCCLSCQREWTHVPCEQGSTLGGGGVFCCCP
jgi:hypothetical protein